MVNIENQPVFERKVQKIRDSLLKLKIKKQIRKIIENPETGKPMKHERKGTREVYVSPFRLSHAYLEEENKIIFLDLYHKDEQILCN